MNEPDEAVREQMISALPRLRRLGRALTRNPDDGDDLVQITVERALRRVEQWQPGSSLEKWMFAIMRNAWIDELRSRQRQRGIFAPEEAGAEVGEESAERQFQQLSIEAALARLPDEQRATVALVLIEGCSYQDAADILQVPIGTVTSRLARARATLQGLLGD
jgi:RNA polymerase sigma-70 factor (ECF subfamily)